MTGIARARRMLAVGSRSFALAGKLLPARCRDDAAVVYAFCRRGDDLVDGAVPGTEGAAVARLRGELTAVYAGAPQDDPVLAAFQEVVRRRQIPREYPSDLIEGFAMDARPRPIRYESWDELSVYCYRVAGTVGLMMCHVMGMTDARHLPHAAALGMAMQLTNIARDVREDLALGRIYVPLAPGDGPPEARLSRALPEVLARALVLYRRGDQGLPALSPRCAIAVRAARLIYSAIGDRVAAGGHDVMAPRAVVPAARKLWLVLRAAVEVLAARAFPSRRRHEIAVG